MEETQAFRILHPGLPAARMRTDRLSPPPAERTHEHLFPESTVEKKKPTRDQSDEELIERCRGEDPEAFTEIVERYQHRIHWLVRRMVGGPEDEDLTQEVFIRVYQAIPGFRSGSKFSTWIYRIAHNLCLSELRKRGRRGEHLSLEEEGDEKIHWILRDSREGLEEEIEQMDLSEKIQTLVGQLPTPHRTALTLFYVNRARYEEIAEIMGIPLGTVKTYIHRAKLRLRDLVLASSDLADFVGESAGETVGDGGQIT
jgi:RNA polymerase sigma-70 factor (ECF subfamily)